MKAEAVKSLRAKLAADEAVYGLWVTLESPSVTEMAVALGLDWVVIDAEHGHLDWNDLVNHVRATVRSRTVCLIRVATLDQGLIKRVLDIGADGVVVPWMESAEQVKAALHAATYAPEGRRGIGAERATAWGRCISEHVAEAKDILVVPIIESVVGGEHVAEMAAVPGVDLFFIGPADWSASAGQAGQWGGSAVAAQIRDTCTAIRAAGKHVGLLTTSDDDLRQRRREGFRMLGFGIDGALLLRALDGMLAAAGSIRKISTDLTPSDQGTAERPLREVPLGLRPERAARVVASANAPRLDLDDRAVVTALVGRHCAARELTAALVRFAPGGSLVRHVHPKAETVVVISGSIVTEVEGRRYVLRAGESIVIPAGASHQTGNADEAAEAVIHVAMPCDAITRTLAAPASRIVERDSVATGEAACEAILRSTSVPQGNVEHAGRERPAAAVRCRSLRLKAGQQLAPVLHAVDAAIVIVAGRIQCRTDSQAWTVEAGDAVHLPRGVVHQVVASQDCHLIETCADFVPLDAAVDPVALFPWPVQAASARAG